MKITENKLIVWSGIVSAVLAVLTPLGLVIAYEVSTAENVAHCVRTLDAHETRLNSIDKSVASIDGYLRGQREPVPAPKDQVTAK